MSMSVGTANLPYAVAEFHILLGKAQKALDKPSIPQALLLIPNKMAKQKHFCWKKTRLLLYLRKILIILTSGKKFIVKSEIPRLSYITPPVSVILVCLLEIAIRRLYGNLSIDLQRLFG